MENNIYKEIDMEIESELNVSDQFIEMKAEFMLERD